MTYPSFLLGFLVLPLALLAAMFALDWLRRRKIPQTLRTYPALLLVLAAAVGLALYATLGAGSLMVAQVWTCNLALVTPGYSLGSIPLETLALFGGAAALCTLWLFWISKRVPLPIRPPPLDNWLRLWASLAVGIVWAASLVVLLSEWNFLTYLALQLTWGLPVIILQLAFGADILWRYRNLVAVGIAAPTLYLWLADAVAVSSGLWTVSPDKSLNMLLAGFWPAEDLLLYLLLAAMSVFGATLGATQENQPRLPQFLRRRRAL